jgi:hypothetical protein
MFSEGYTGIYGSREDPYFVLRTIKFNPGHCPLFRAKSKVFLQTVPNVVYHRPEEEDCSNYKEDCHSDIFLSDD